MTATGECPGKDRGEKFRPMSQFTPLLRLVRAPVLRAVLALGLSGVITAAAIQAVWHGFAIDPPLWVKLMVAGLLASALGAAMRLPRWWWGLLALAPAALVAARALDPPAWAYGVVVLIAALTLFNSVGERVPLFLTGRATRRAITNLIDAQAPVRAVDLGCGLGGPVLAMAAANRHPESRFLGVETAPLPFAVAWVRARLRGDRRVRIALRSMWSLDLGQFDIVYAFLSPAPMPRLMAKASAEMSAPALFVSNEFTDPDYPPDDCVVPEGGGRVLNLWHAPIGKPRPTG